MGQVELYRNRAAGNRTQSSCSQSTCTTGILQPATTHPTTNYKGHILSFMSFINYLPAPVRTSDNVLF